LGDQEGSKGINRNFNECFKGGLQMRLLLGFLITGLSKGVFNESLMGG